MLGSRPPRIGPLIGGRGDPRACVLRGRAGLEVGLGGRGGVGSVSRKEGGNGGRGGVSSSSSGAAVS
jgi:hypothetical protein